MDILDIARKILDGSPVPEDVRRCYDEVQREVLTQYLTPTSPVPRVIWTETHGVVVGGGTAATWAVAFLGRPQGQPVDELKPQAYRTLFQDPKTLADNQRIPFPTTEEGLDSLSLDFGVLTHALGFMELCGYQPEQVNLTVTFRQVLFDCFPGEVTIARKINS
jgi:hypothetical protein